MDGPMYKLSLYGVISHYISRDEKSHISAS